ncbi:LexA family transcriptional regulator [Paramagnetospirillum magneticum]|uniref:Peptidase S24/S26A/S26B/S26C domain-containing protein n=1 Tax=Paramagnetospirillum magneticum (strain ATCC 700264 / AMB-1) TaxID=342108 RepID=Q2W5Z0_PARM1|nr:LexA family transcriptional regulator [Paramagnetospirillum magneticum]BAE50735.1 hypothetical protein amb1931 [Paramagnetospirillum magneticum AMB-1]
MPPKTPTLADIRRTTDFRQQDVAEELRTSQPHYAMVERGLRSAPEDWTPILAKMWDVTEDEIELALIETYRQGAPRRKEETAKRRDRPVDPAIAGNPLQFIHKLMHQPTTPSPQIPIRAVGRAGPAQEAFIGDGPVDWTERPAFLRGVDAYGVYVAGTSMVPRYRPGQLVFVDPHRPPVNGQGVVVVRYDNAVLIKEFVGYGLDHDEDVVILREYAPVDREFAVFGSEITAIHVIVGTKDA